MHKLSPHDRTAVTARWTVALLLAVSTIAQGQENSAPAPAPTVPGAPASPVQTEMQKWIAKTDEGWQAALKRDVTDVQATELEKLKQQYVSALDAAATKASAAGDLDGVVALRNEEKRFAGTNLFPEQDEATDVATVKQIRAAVRAQIAKLEKDAAARTKALHAKYDAVLADAQARLTKAQRIEDALLVKAKREEVAKAWITSGIGIAPDKTGLASTQRPVATPAPASPARPPTPAPFTAGTTTGQTFEERMIGTTWNFPWGTGGTHSIRFEENGKLVILWDVGAKRKWHTPRDGVIDVFPYVDQSRMDTIQINASGRTGVFTREGKKYTMDRKK